MNRIVVKTQDADVKISRHIYGHFSEHLGRCIYGGFWVGNDPAAAESIPNVRGVRKDVAAALRNIKIPNLRWPGGCFADEYHWQDGIGSPADRPKMVNTHWGGVTEDNSFGVHEFLDLCEQLSCADAPRCEPYICGNVGSGTVRELSQWVEYCNFDGISPMADLRRRNGRETPWNVKFWGIGNENWGCGGNMTPEFYADTYRRYATYARSYGAPLYKIACGPSDENYEWTRVLMEKAGKYMDGLSLHYYTIPGDWNDKGSATKFSSAEYYAVMRKALRMDEFISRHTAIMDEFDPAKRIGLIADEWGCWLDVEPGTNPGFLYQQNSLRDALTAAIHFNIFNNHAERVFMANIAQTINVLQAVILTEGAQMILTPTYHVFDLYKVHQNAVKLPVYVESESVSGLPAVSVSASEDEAGKMSLSLTNIDIDKEQEIRIDLRGYVLSSSVNLRAQIVTSENATDHNTFEKPDTVNLADFKGFSIAYGKLSATLPPKSAVTIELK